MGSLFAQMRACRSTASHWTFSSVTNVKFHWLMWWFGQRNESFRKIGWTARKFWKWWVCRTTMHGKSSNAPTPAWWKTPIGYDSARMKPLRTPRADEPEELWTKIKRAADTKKPNLTVHPVQLEVWLFSYHPSPARAMVDYFISLIQRVTALQGRCPDFPVPEWCAGRFSAWLSC